MCIFDEKAATLALNIFLEIGKTPNHVRNDRKSVMPENTFFNL